MSRAMKDSGHAWLGDIPAHWKVEKFKNLFQIKKDIAGALGYDVLSVTQKGIKIKDITKNEGQLAQDYSKYQLVYPNDFAMNHMDLLTGYVDCSTQMGVTSPDYRTFKAIDRNKTVDKYFLRIFQFCYADAIFYKLGQGVSNLGRWRLPADQQNRFPLPLPSKEEQQTIADFLDVKCAEVDEMIALQEKIIDELKLYKQSVITEVVTKGLNPDAPMKDSGIEWIGEIPGHWEVDILSQLFYEHRHKNVDLIETNLLSLSYGKIIRKDINTNEGLLPQSFEGYNILSNGDIVFRLTDLQNDKSSLRTGLATEGGIITSAYVTIRKREPLNSSYFHYLFHSYDLCKVFYGLGDGVRQGMNYNDLRKILVIIPTLEEQQAIADLLDIKCAEIDELSNIKQQKIDELKEYKKSIIYEYVTGKKQVKTQ